MKKKFFILFFAVLFLLPHPKALAAGTATVSVEAFTVGAGYLVSPTQAEAGANAADVLLRLLAENGYTAFYGGTPETSFYLAYVADGDKTGDYNGYRCASALYPVEHPKKLRFKTEIAAPLRDYLASHAGYFDENDYEENAPGYLGEFVYTDLSGWMYSLNGAFLQKDLAGVTLAAGDVLRLQFTLCLGADIGGADPDVQAAYDAALRVSETKAPETTAEAPETRAAVSESKAAVSETKAEAPETKAKAPETTADAHEAASRPPAATAEAPETTTEAPETTTETPETTTETPETTAASPETTTDAPADDGAPAKRLTGVLITVITAAAAAGAAAAAIIAKKKKKEYDTK